MKRVLEDVLRIIKVGKDLLEHQVQLISFSKVTACHLPATRNIGILRCSYSEK